MYRKITAIALIATILMSIVIPVQAITSGESDENRHPNVGLVLADLRGDGTPLPFASGTLISPTVFLTAGHATLYFFRVWDHEDLGDVRH